PRSGDSLYPVTPPSCPSTGDLLDRSRFPALVEEGLERAVEPKDGEPAFAGQGQDEVAVLHAVGLFRPEIDGGRAVGVRLSGRAREALAAGPWETLRGLQHRAGLVVVERERPELRRRDVRRQRHLVGLDAVEGLAARIENSE